MSHGQVEFLKKSSPLIAPVQRNLPREGDDREDRRGAVQTGGVGR